jgi:hypothetical protein
MNKPGDSEGCRKTARLVRAAVDGTFCADPRLLRLAVQA